MTTTHYLDFLCDGYAGNFELEFVSYVFNCPEWDNERRDYAQFLTAEEKAEADRVLGEDFLEYFYGEYGLTNVELEAKDHPETGQEYGTIQVRLEDETWQRVDRAEAVALLKARAEKFFTLYLDKLPSYQQQEGAFVALVHSSRTMAETEPELL